MSKIIAFEPFDREPDLDRMDREQLEAYLRVLSQQIAALDAREPRNEESEAYDDWAQEHEDLEDLMDEVLDLLDDLT